MFFGSAIRRGIIPDAEYSKMAKHSENNRQQIMHIPKHRYVSEHTCAAVLPNVPKPSLKRAAPP